MYLTPTSFLILDMVLERFFLLFGEFVPGAFDVTVESFVG
jgi:hypothetical protein